MNEVNLNYNGRHIGVISVFVKVLKLLLIIANCPLDSAYVIVLRYIFDYLRMLARKHRCYIT